MRSEMIRLEEARLLTFLGLGLNEGEIGIQGEFQIGTAS